MSTRESQSSKPRSLVSRHLMLADADARSAYRVATMLRSHGWEVDVLCDEPSVRSRLGTQHYDVLLIDLELPGLGGVSGLSSLISPSPATVLMSAKLDVDVTLAALRAGVADVLEKPIEPAQVLEALEGARQRGSSQPPPALPELTGRSRPMRRLSDQIMALAAYRDLPLLIVGETGTGKELVARAVHRGDGDEEMVSLNCAAVPEALFESELFGHVQGAFTGAREGRVGLLEQAGSPSAGGNQEGAALEQGRQGIRSGKVSGPDQETQTD